MIDSNSITEALLREYRKGKTYQEIAKDGGVSYSYLHEIMTHKRSADSLTVKKLNSLFPDCILSLTGDHNININAPRPSDSVIGVNNSVTVGNFLDTAIDKILGSEELSDAEKVKVLKVLKK